MSSCVVIGQYTSLEVLGMLGLVSFRKKIAMRGARRYVTKTELQDLAFAHERAFFINNIRYFMDFEEKKF